jgi:hypothetical protein
MHSTNTPTNVATLFFSIQFVKKDHEALSTDYVIVSYYLIYHRLGNPLILSKAYAL